VVRVIAIDGPAASGKSSTAARVADRLGGGWAHLDSGALYRAVTLAAIDHLAEAERSGQRIVGLAEALPVRLVLVGSRFLPEVSGVDVEEAIRSQRVTSQVSAIASLPEVRTWVNARQRLAVAAHPQGVVVDGRDIGTVVFPEAPLKVFLTATPKERARRRIVQRGEAPDDARVLTESRSLEARDQADASRPVAPLRAAADALMLDSTRLSLEQQVDQVVALAQQRFRE
jgi:cytidylate kinase